MPSSGSSRSPRWRGGRALKHHDGNVVTTVRMRSHYCVGGSQAVHAAGSAEYRRFMSPSFRRHAMRAGIGDEGIVAHRHDRREIPVRDPFRSGELVMWLETAQSVRYTILRG